MCLSFDTCLNFQIKSYLPRLWPRSRTPLHILKPEIPLCICKCRIPILMRSSSQSSMHQAGVICAYDGCDGDITQRLDHDHLQFTSQHQLPHQLYQTPPRFNMDKCWQLITTLLHCFGGHVTQTVIMYSYTCIFTCPHVWQFSARISRLCVPSWRDGRKPTKWDCEAWLTDGRMN